MKPADQRVLMTGAGGFIGRALKDELQRVWPEATFLTTSRREHPGLCDEQTRTAKVDLCDEARTAAIVADFQPTTVVHLAAQSSVHLAATAPLDMWRGNFLATYNLLNGVARSCPDAHFVFASSGECYGESFLEADQLSEEAPLRPTNAYGRSKVASEYMIRDVHKGPSLILRLFNQIGPGQDERFVTSSFAAQLVRIERGEAPPRIQVGDLSAERDFSDIDDMVRAVSLLLQRTPPAGASTFNVCSGQTRSVRSVLEEMLKLVSVDIEIEVDPARLRPSAVARASGSSAALREACGWSPRIELSDTLGRLLDYWRERLVRSS